jgi:hypothetical protein
MSLAANMFQVIKQAINTPIDSGIILKSIEKIDPEWLIKKGEKQAKNEISGYLSQMFAWSNNDGYNGSGKRYNMKTLNPMIHGLTVERDNKLYTFLELQEIEETEEIDQAVEDEKSELTREKKIKSDYDQLSTFEKFKIDQFYSIVKQINNVLNLRRNQDKSFYFEVDHCQTIKEGGSHIASNLQLITQEHNAVKNYHSTDRMTWDHQYDYIMNTVSFYKRNRLIQDHDVDHVISVLIQQLKILY